MPSRSVRRVIDLPVLCFPVNGPFFLRTAAPPGLTVALRICAQSESTWPVICRSQSVRPVQPNEAALPPHTIIALSTARSCSSSR